MKEKPQMSSVIDELNAEFGIKDKIHFFEGAGNLPFVLISSEHASAVVCLYGAHVISYIPRGHNDLLWLSRKVVFARGRAIRGGIPVCWPWFGAHPDNADAPAHGFARISEWNVSGILMLDDGSIQISLRLPAAGEFSEFWGYDTLGLVSIIVGRELEVNLSTVNMGDKPVPITAALHSYFSVGNIKKVQVRGLENERFLDMLTESEGVESKPLAVSCEVDRVYLEHSGECQIADSKLERCIRILKEGSNSTVVWNPWIDKSCRMSDFGDNEYKKMICVETTNSHEDARVLMPGEDHTLSTIIGPV
jgi:D-hexose-6-phosphate mutarotase